MFTQPVSVSSPAHLRAYQGGFMSVLLLPEQSNGNLAAIELTSAPGSEPPRHIHTREDEVFHILEGSVRFQIGDDVVDAHPGQTVLAPRNIAHQFQILTPEAKMLIMLTPGDFVNYFMEWSEPIDEAPAVVTAPQGPPPVELMALWIKQLDERYGIAFV